MEVVRHLPAGTPLTTYRPVGAFYAIADPEHGHIGFVRQADVAVPGMLTAPRSISIEELERLLSTAPSTLSSEDLQLLDAHYEREQVRQLRQIKWIVGAPLGLGALGSIVAILTRVF